MPITIPPSTSYQAPLIPVASRWAKAPPEGPKFIAAEIDWGITTPVGQGVQFSLNAGPLEFSQINAFSVDNSRCGGDVSFIFPDTGRQLTVPSLASGVFPVFTNSLTFYAIAPAALAGDVTEFEILNTTPPPVSVLPSQEQSLATNSGANLTAVGTYLVGAAGVNGTLQGANIILTNQAATGIVSGTIYLQDGTGLGLWGAGFSVTAGQTSTINLTGLKLRFVNGLYFRVASTAGTGPASAAINAYFAIP